MQRPIRVLIAKIGLDGHDRGAKLIVRHLRDSGMEVIYTGLWKTPAAAVHAALQEDVDILGVSLHSAAHMTIMPEVVRLCRESDIPDVPVIIGGIIPAHDYEPLRAAGVPSNRYARRLSATRRGDPIPAACRRPRGGRSPTPHRTKSW